MNTESFPIDLTIADIVAYGCCTLAILAVISIILGAFFGD